MKEATLKPNYKPSDYMIKSLVKKVIKELNRAITKHPKWSDDNIHRAAIVMEEAGEIIRAANLISEAQGTVQDLEMELIQTAGTCIRMLLLLQEDQLPF